jgi:hypothetical protein
MPSIRPTKACADLTKNGVTPISYESYTSGASSQVPNCIARICQEGETPCGPTENQSTGKCVVCAYSTYTCDKSVQDACNGKKVEGGYTNWYWLYYYKTNSGSYATQCIKYAWKENKPKAEVEKNSDILDVFKPC